MACDPLIGPDGQVLGIVCSRGRRQRDKRCKCGRVASKLCDFPLKGKKAGQTCDRPLCDRCAVVQGPDRDYCRAHDQIARQGGLGL